jgi:hypothetical protein
VKRQIKDQASQWDVNSDERRWDYCARVWYNSMGPDRWMAIMMDILDEAEFVRREGDNTDAKSLNVGGVDGTRTRDPRRDRPEYKPWESSVCGDIVQLEPGVLAVIVTGKGDDVLDKKVST